MPLCYEGPLRRPKDLASACLILAEATTQHRTERDGAAWLRSSRRKEDPSVARKQLCNRQFRVALSQDDNTRLTRLSS